MSDMPWYPGSSEVRVSRHSQSAWVPLVMNVLRAVEAPAVAVTHGAGAYAGDVAAGVGLGDGDRQDRFAGHRRRQPAGELLG